MKTHATRFLLILPLLLFVFSCQQQETPYATDSIMQEKMQETDQREAEEEEPAPDTERKLIKEGWITFETDDLAAARGRIEHAISRYKGYLSSDQESDGGNRISTTLVVRVPAAQFDSLLAAVSEGVKRFEDKNIQVKDVTAEFLDIQARLKTKKELEARYLALLQQAKSVSEILEIEKQAGELRAEIESIEGRLKYLSNQVGFSTLTITVYEQVSRATGFGQEFQEGFSSGWKNLIWFFVGLTHIWPFLVLIAAFLGFFWWRKRKRS